MIVNKEIILERVKQIIIKQLGVDIEEITPESKFIDDLGADSLDIIEVIRSLEMEFELDIPDEAAEGIATVNDAIEYITQNIDDGAKMLVKNVS